MARVDDLNRDLFRQLARFTFANYSSMRQPSNYEIALKILSDTQGKLDFSQTWSPALGGGVSKKPSEGDGGPSVFSRIVDILARPLYASASAYKASGGLSSGFGLYKSLLTGDVPDDPFAALSAGVKAGVEGFKGKDKTTYSQLIRASDDVPNFAKEGIPGFITGLGADILGDPLTYVPIVGPAKAAVRGGAKVLGKTHPQWADPTYIKRMRKRAKVGAPRLTEPPPIVPLQQTPRSLMASFAAENVRDIPRGISGSLPSLALSPESVSQVVSEAVQKGVKAAGTAKSAPRTSMSWEALMGVPRNLWGKVVVSGKALVLDAGPGMEKVIHHASEIPGFEGVSAAKKAQLAEKLVDELNLSLAERAHANRIIEAIRSGKFSDDFLYGPKLADLVYRLGPIDDRMRDVFKRVTGKDLPSKYGKPRLIIGKNNKLKTTIPASPAATIQAAMEDAPLVNTALSQGANELAIAENVLSPQQAALHAKTIREDGKTILEAAEASSQAQKTYDELMEQITFKSRGPLQNAIDRHADKLTVPVNTMLRKRVRGPKGRFLPSSKQLVTVSKIPSSKSFAPSSTLNIKTRPDVEKAAKAVSRPSDLEKIKGIFGPVNDAVSRAIRDHAGIQVTKVKPGQTLDEKSVKYGLLARFSTHLGQKDLRPMVLDHLGSAVARSTTRLKAIEDAFRGFKEGDVIEAWDLARGALPRELATSAENIELADILTGQMELFFRSRAIPETIAKGNSVAMRTGMSMEDLNRALARYDLPFRFTNKVATDPVTGNPLDYGHRSNWLISWETFKPKDMQELKRFIFGLQSAAEQLTAEYAFLDDVAYRMGSRGKTKTHRFKVDHPRLVDYYFDKDIASQLSRALKTMSEYYSPKSKAARFMRRAISMWKSGVTIYNPRHYITNLIGDVHLAWLAGVNDPRVFAQAAKVMHANKGLYKDLASIEDLVGRDAVKNVMAKPGSIVAKNKSGLSATAQQIYVNAFNLGILQKSGVLEDIAIEGVPLPGRLARPFGGRVHDFVAKRHESRDHYVRLAHFIDVFQKTRTKNIKEAFEIAAHEVRKWHPDGLDLTKEEQKIRALLIPFYSWMRKSTPLVIEGAFMRPQKAFMAYSKTGYNLQQALGIEGTTLSDPYPDDQLFPDWLKETNTPVLGKSSASGLAGVIGRLGRQAVDDEGKPIDAYTLLGPTNPVQDFFTQFGGFRNPRDMWNATISSLNPAFKIPLELQQGRELYTDIPLEGRHADWITGQIPMVNQAARMFNVGPFGPTGRAEKYGVGPQQEPIINWLTSANLTGTGPFIKSAEFEQLPKRREENKRIREFANTIGYPVKDKGRIPDWIRELYYQRQGAQ